MEVGAHGGKDAREVWRCETQGLFVVEMSQAQKGRAYRYMCGSCGAPLLYRATRELLDCTFLCRDCKAINEAPFLTNDNVPATT